LTISFPQLMEHYIELPQALLFFALSFLLVLGADLLLVASSGNGRTKETHKERAYRYTEEFYEITFADTAILLFISTYVLIDWFTVNPAIRSLWDNYGDFLLLAFLVCASLFNTILDHGFVPLKHVSGSMRSSMRMASMVYLTVLFLYIKFIYEDNNYDSIIIYFIGMMIGRFVYFDATFHDFVSAMKQLRFALPFVGLALLVTALLALYGFHTQYLWKSNSVVISLLIAHLHMDLAIFILARSHFVSLFFRRQEESRREPVRRDKRRRGENAEEEDLSFEDIPDDDYGYDFYTDEETDPYESKSGRKRWR
jgi:hypothetical protein